jgi:Protein of unknown function (DUF3617)
LQSSGRDRNLDLIGRSARKISGKNKAAIRAIEALMSIRTITIRDFAGAAFAVAVAAIPSLARAEDPPSRKPGLWEITSSMKDAPKTQMCVDAASEAKFNAMGAGTMKDTCSQFQSHRDGALYTLDSVCKLMGSTLTSHTVMTSVDDGEYKVDVVSHYDPPLMGKADSTTTMTGKWIGPCGPNMKPGDMMINGMKVHPGAQQ